MSPMIRMATDLCQAPAAKINVLRPRVTLTSMFLLPSSRPSMTLFMLRSPLVLLDPSLWLSLGLSLLLWLLRRSLGLPSLWLSLLLVLLNLGPLLILLLPLLPDGLSLLWRPALITLDAPGFLRCPIVIRMPVLPVLLEPLVRNPFIVPRVPAPIMVSVVSSPTGVHVEIETGNMVEITPAPVIIMRAVPATVPWAPPPAIIEEQVYTYLGSDVDVGRVRHRYHIGRRVEYYGRRQRDVNVNSHLCHRWNRNDGHHWQ